MAMGFCIARTFYTISEVVFGLKSLRRFETFARILDVEFESNFGLSITCENKFWNRDGLLQCIGFRIAPGLLNSHEL